MSTRRTATTAAVDTSLQPCQQVILPRSDTVGRVRQAISRAVWRRGGGKHACRVVI
jgi:hypothetical protein